MRPWLLVWKMSFLVAIISARQVGELRIPWHDPQYLTVHAEEISLLLDITFLPKVISAFYLHSIINLPTFFPSPQTTKER